MLQGERVPRHFQWAYAVTTVTKRRRDLLPHTLKALARSGFDKPNLFIDGVTFEEASSYEKEFNLPVEVHRHRIRTLGNWVLGIANLYLRNPDADRFAMFQDDLTTGVNLRAYLEKCPSPVKGYLNLYTFPRNHARCPVDASGKKKVGWYLSDQLGKGAVGLVFTNEGVISLLQQHSLIFRPKDVARRWRWIDGAIVEAMKNAGYKEFVHNPSLVQHTGHLSTMDNMPHEQANSYRGDVFDYLTLLPEIFR